MRPNTRRIIAVIAGLMLIPGCFSCWVFLMALSFGLDSGSDPAELYLPLILLTMTLGAGGLTLFHSRRSSQKRPSGPLLLPNIWILLGLFGLLIVLLYRPGRLGPLAPFVLLTAAALPPLWSVGWFIHRAPGSLTWRRGMVALAGGATLSVLVAVTLEILFPALALALVYGLADTAASRLETLIQTLSNSEIASAVTNPAFLYLLVEIALIAPLAEELAKPLPTLLLVKSLSRRDAFFLGAMSGVGFAIIENLIYAGLSGNRPAGVLALRALGGAIHPLGSGLVAMGWRDLLRGEAAGWTSWLRRFALASGLHALWNGGSILVLTLAGAHFFGDLPAEIDLLGVSAAGLTLALLITLGLGALWIGRRVGRPEGIPTPFEFALTDRNAAIWALACLVILLPAGITGLKLLFW